MENQHRQIKGYRELNEAEIALEKLEPDRKVE